ncbi:TRAP transporter large permease subunit [Mameliella alba]|nr:TRAP transporter large permease subunit [Antarctobacter heliothermus]MBY6143396.1 TRAP transporter large permease subunit [Mameliella alba]MCA0952879.1 TRAP transporter large permease subunit [Mameliella alba]
MSPEEILLILLGLGLMALISGGPIGLLFGGMAMGLAYFSWGPQAFQLVATTAKSSVDSFLLLSIPMFVFMGQNLTRSGLGEAMFHAGHVLAGRLKGGLAIAVILVCSLIGAMVGIVGAGIMTAGTVALKPMFDRGYDRRLALGVIMAGGGLGILIPPSVPMIVFASVTQTSVGQMFAAALGPAALMIACYILYVVIYCRINPEAGPPLPREVLGGTREKLVAARDGAMAFGLIIIVLGSILGGIATPTEAGAVGAVAAIGIAMIYRRYSFSVLKESSVEAMRLTGVIVWILIGVTVFTNYIMFSGGGRLFREFAGDLGVDPIMVIILMQVSMLIMGFFIDEFIIVVVCAPIYTPIAVSLGFDPVWFGILMILNMQIAIQTPPYGFALFYLKAVAPRDVSMVEIYRSVGPFVLIQLTVLITCMLVPGIVTWLPSLLFP